MQTSKSFSFYEINSRVLSWLEFEREVLKQRKIDLSGMVAAFEIEKQGA